MSRTTSRRFDLPPGAALLPEPVVAAASLTPPIDLAKLFGRAAPVEVEVGFGKGRFLLAEAAARPETNFLGIENAAPYLRFVRHRALVSCLGNVRLLAVNARDTLHRLLPDASLQAVYVLFPDPWPKRTHQRRRLVDASLAADLARTLALDGGVHIVTDNEPYAIAIRAALATEPRLERQPTCLLEDLASRTHYAAKLAIRGVAFHAHTWIRRR